MRRLVAILAAVLLLPTFTNAVPVGAPEIDALSVDRDRLEGGAEVVVDGRNFVDGMEVALGDAAVTDLTVESATRVRLRVPPQRFAGGRTLTIRTAAGTVQRVFHVLPLRFDEILDGEITSIAGGIPYLGDGEPATGAAVGLDPSGVAVDRDGNLFVSDGRNNRVRRVDAATGTITTVAGNGAKAYDGDGGPAVAASLDYPRALAFDLDGSLLVADHGNNRIRRVDAVTGIISTIHRIGFPYDLEVDEAGDLYVASLRFSKVVEGEVVRVDRATDEETRLDLGDGIYPGPYGLAREADGRILIAAPDSLRLLRYDPATGQISDVAEFTDGEYWDVLPDPDGTLLLLDPNYARVVRLDPETGATTPVAGDGDFGYDGDGGPAVDARLARPIAFATDTAGNLYIADSFNARIRRVDTTGTIATVVGNGQFSTPGDGWPATSTRVGASHIALDPAGNVYLSQGHRVRRVDAATGIITTVAGAGQSGFSGDGGPATSATLSAPSGLALDRDGNLFVADTGNHRIRRVDAATGVITTVAGNGGAGEADVDGPATERQLGYPSDLAFDRAGKLYVAHGNSPGALRRVNLDANTIRMVRSVLARYIAIDRSGSIYVSKFNTISRIPASGGPVQTVAGMQEPGTPIDGQKAKISRVSSFGIAVDRAGNLVFANWYFYIPPFAQLDASVRRIGAQNKRIETLVGGAAGRWDYGGDGGPALEAGIIPQDVAFDRAGTLYVGDGNGRVRVVKGIGRP